MVLASREKEVEEACVASQYDGYACWACGRLTHEHGAAPEKARLNPLRLGD
jgi:hypothetical protein